MTNVSDMSLIQLLTRQREVMNAEQLELSDK